MAAFSSVPWSIALALLISAYIVFSYTTSYRRLSHIPGPRLAAWSNLWWIRAASSKRGHLRLNEVCEQYGMYLNRLLSTKILM